MRIKNKQRVKAIHGLSKHNLFFMKRIKIMLELEDCYQLNFKCQGWEAAIRIHSVDIRELESTESVRVDQRSGWPNFPKLRNIQFTNKIVTKCFGELKIV